MNPSKEKGETAIREYKRDIIAMNILGGGAFARAIIFVFRIIR